jgi:hypothetical protein
MDTRKKYFDPKKGNGPDQGALQIVIIDTPCQSYAKPGRGHRGDQMGIKDKLNTLFFDRKGVM